MATTENDLKSLREELGTLRKDFSRIAETLERTARHGGEEAVNRAHRSADWVRDEAKKAAHGVVHEFEERPITGILSIFAVGLVLGVLFAGRR